MKNYIVHDPWKIIENEFVPQLVRNSESLFSIGNGSFGQRANFEETYSGDTLSGSYVAGVYYPDKTRVGWWKNGYPEYFAKVLNAPNWIHFKIWVDDEELDMSKCDIHSFERVLDMEKGTLKRNVHLTTKNGAELKIASERYCSMNNAEIGALKYQITLINKTVDLNIESYLSSEVYNEDSNYDEHFWEHEKSNSSDDYAYVQCSTKKTQFHVGVATITNLQTNEPITSIQNHHSTFNASNRFETVGKPNKTITLYKYGAVISSMNHNEGEIESIAQKESNKAAELGYDLLKQAHIDYWRNKWDECDIEIEGDVAAQQAIRFNIFQLNQTYTGEDPRYNIGPKGFTGEKYGGSTYWDTEAYCIPFYLSTAPKEVARNLLIYRYKHLDKAIENAQKLGFDRGAALYPMVTMNGEECHNEWEITFEEIHRNGAIAYAIYDYINYTGDDSYLAEAGLEVLIGIARFWSQRVNWSEKRQQYVMLGVTGPNEFENNVNNNWYTNKLAVWCMHYTHNKIVEIQDQQPSEWSRIAAKTQFALAELDQWQKITSNMYYPFDEELQIFLQQDNFLDKEIIPVSDLKDTERPIVEHWSWDRILRSCYIKQADVLQGFYFFEDEFDEESHRRHFKFYEPITVHESSLSPCVHSILAAKLGMEEKAYEMYLRTARLDLDDYNNDTRDGLHITSMAGTWLTITKGFAGMRVKEGKLTFNPMIPKQWTSYRFRVNHNEVSYDVNVTQKGVEVNEVNQKQNL